MMLTYGSLCSGYGGLDLAVEAVFGARPLWHAEVEPAACTVLEAHWPGVPNLGDLTAVDWKEVARMGARRNNELAQAANPNDGEDLEQWQARRERVKATKKNGNGFGMPLAIAVRLLPTPTAMDSAGSRGHKPDGTPYTATSGVSLTDAAMAATGVHAWPKNQTD